MPDIWLIRHGQAGDLMGDYDRLSDLGVRQAQACGARARHLAPVHQLWAGAMRRHHATAAGFGETFGPLPPLQEDPRWNEFDHQDVIRVALGAGLAPPDGQRPGFLRFFHEAMGRWASGAHDADYGESYAAFQGRVVAAFDALVAGLGPGETALVFTSGGVISGVCRALLDLRPDKAFALNTVLVNTGLTRIRVGDGRRSLATLNAHPHFDEQPDLLSRS